ncbi:MAG: putative acetyltransferase, family [Devosia sp.]|uniref:GNAT family N-acetyltransferase n=1 Tax=Devosia sp. TaxID=1871048 RepID=UPI002638D179|nr:GNAT family N-acetyltransferase [Devosia sp.]MDB5538291.1 putative acetyltransferase, family [Devosia sp.]
METVFKLDPAPTEIDRVVHPLVAHNSALVGRTQFQPFLISLPDPTTGESAGDLAGYVDYDWLIIQFVFIPEHLRRRGHGRALMQRAEAFARERGLIGIWLDTFSFQTPAFYEALGYAVFGTIEDHPRGSRRHFMQKRLDGATS